MKQIIFIYTIILLFLVSVNSIQVNQKQVTQEDINESFNNFMLYYYCGNSDGYPHWRFKFFPDFSDCYSLETEKVYDRDFWSDATSNFVILDYQKTHQLSTKANFFLFQIFNDYNIQLMRNYLLWDKIGDKILDKYGVINDDRLWYAIAMYRIHCQIGQYYKKQGFQNIKQYLNNISLQEFEDKLNDFATLSIEIFDWIYSEYWDQYCKGGIWWDIDKTYKNAVTNELFIELATRIYENSRNTNYLNVAIKAANWFINDSQLIDQSSGLINDGVHPDNKLLTFSCNDIENYKYTYNQGIILLSLAQLSNITSDDKYQNIADDILNGVLNKQNGFVHQIDSGVDILKEPWSFNNTRSNFKGIFIEHLGYMIEFQQQNGINVNVQYVEFLKNNYNQVWNMKNIFTLSYPYDWYITGSELGKNINASTTTSVLAAYNAYNLVIDNQNQDEQTQIQ